MGTPSFRNIPGGGSEMSMYVKERGRGALILRKMRGGVNEHLRKRRGK